MQKINIEDMYDRQIDEVYSVEEVYFLQEMQKEGERRGIQLEIPKSVRILEKIAKSEDYMYLKTGLCATQNVARYYKVEDIKIQIAYTLYVIEEAEEWEKLRGYSVACGYVKVCVQYIWDKWLEGKKPTELDLTLQKKGLQDPAEFRVVLILQMYGNRFLKGLRVKYGKIQNDVQPEWEAYVQYRKERGYMEREYARLEKYAYMTSEYAVGDVVLYYRREKRVKSKAITPLLSCYPAVIQAITQKGVTFVYYPNIETKLTRARRVTALERERPEYVASPEDMLHFAALPLTIEWSGVGVDGYIGEDEEEFLLGVIDGVDTHRQYIIEGGKVENKEFTTRELIHYVFQERGLEYNYASVNKEREVHSEDEYTREYVGI